jgi:basic membrane protein A and related proteins
MRFRRNLMGVAALAASLALVAGACGSDEDDGGAADTTAAEAETTAAETTAGAETTAAGGDTTAAPATGECQPGTGTVEPIATAEADGAGKTMGLLFDVTGRGDKSFNDGAAAGMDKAAADFGIETDESEPTGDADRPERIAGFVGKDLIVAVGFLWGDATTASAAENPDQLYAIIDSVVNVPDSDPPTPAPNVRSMVFAEQEGSFLVGAAAACASPTGKLGFIGGVENDLIKKFEAGYVAGAQAVNPDATVEVQYITQPPDFTGFNDPAKGKAIATAMYDSGIDVIYAAAGGSGDGLFEAALESGKAPGEIYAIGVDSDQYEQVAPELQPYILTSALKRVDVATYEAITDMLNGELKGEVKVYNAANNGVGYAISNEAINQYAGTLEDLKAQIIDGTIVVPETPGG